MRNESAYNNSRFGAKSRTDRAMAIACARFCKKRGDGGLHTLQCGAAASLACACGRNLGGRRGNTFFSDFISFQNCRIFGTLSFWLIHLQARESDRNGPDRYA